MSIKIEIADFGNTVFNEIPHQDNPATEHLVTDYPKRRHCLMIVNSGHFIGGKGFCVLDVYNPKNKGSGDGVHHIGIFWKHENALMFAEKYIAELNKEEK